jgi:hypothetical protein
MSDDIRRLVEEHHPYYEVLPYYVVTADGHGSPTATTHRIQAGFDIDIYAATTSSEMAPRPDYALGYAILQKNAVSLDVSDCGSIEVLPFLSSFFLDAQNDFQPQAMIRIRISHWRGLDQPAGAAEERALKEIERRLRDVGVRSGKSATFHSGSTNR